MAKQIIQPSVAFLHWCEPPDNGGLVVKQASLLSDKKIWNVLNHTKVCRAIMKLQSTDGKHSKKKKTAAFVQITQARRVNWLHLQCFYTRGSMGFAPPSVSGCVQAPLYHQHCRPKNVAIFTNVNGREVDLKYGNPL